MTRYSSKFYARRHDRTLYAATAVLSIVRKYVTPLRSAADVGCGVGTWLSVLESEGIDDVRGYDGEWVDPDVLEIDRAHFECIDLSRATVESPRRFDLALSLEVAEHLPAEQAQPFVDSLTRLSDVVLFSAAIPHQGGTNHVNEQWQHYWVERFAERGYGVHDLVRPVTWKDERIPYWYRQNALLFVADARARELDLPRHHPGGPVLPLDVVHPELYLRSADTHVDVSKSVHALRRAIRGFAKRRLGRTG